MSSGYSIAYSDYPPGASVLLHLIQKGSLWTGVDNFLLLKISIAAAAWLGALVFWLWSGRLLATIGLLFAVLLNTAAHGYLDGLYLPVLLLSLWLLQRRQLEWAAFFYVAAISVKWQPIIIAPFWAAYACEFRLGNLLKPREWLLPLRRVTLGAAPLLLVGFLLFKPAAILDAFIRALTSHKALSFQALNSNWVLQFITYKIQGASGIPFFEIKAPLALSLLVRALFYGSYVFVLFSFLRARRSFADFIWFSCVGFLTYFTLNVGVHENHLFVAVVLSFAALCVQRPRAMEAALFISVMASLNLLIFYGIDGRTPLPSPAATGATLILGLLNTFFLAAALWRIACHDQSRAPAATSEV
jgi:hypothetical protein